MNTKTQLEVLSIIKDIIEQMKESNSKGIARVSYYIENVELNDVFKLYEGFKITDCDAKLYFLGESFNADTIDISYKVMDGHYINISSVKQNELKPKINLINFN